MATSDSGEDSVSSSLVLKNGTVLTTDNGDISISSDGAIEWNRLGKLIEEFESQRDKLKATFNDGFSDQWAKVEESFKKVKDAFQNVKNKELSGTDKVKQSLDGIKDFFGTLGQFLAELKNIEDMGLETKDVIFSLLDFIKPTNYLNVFVGATGSGGEKSLSAAGTVGFLNQSVSSGLQIGKNVFLTAKGTDKKGNLTVYSGTTNESLALGGHLGNIFGIPFPQLESAKYAVGGSVIINQVKTDNKLIAQEGARLTADGAVALTAEDRVNLLTIGGGVDVNTDCALIADVLAAVSQFEASNLLWLDDEVEISGGSVLVNATRDDDIQTIAGSVIVAVNDDASKSAAVGLALNLGQLGNELQIKDNDKEDSGESLDNLEGSITSTGENLQQGQKGSIEILASERLTMNAVGAAGSVAITGSMGGEQGAFEKFVDWIKDKKAVILGKEQAVNDWVGTWSKDFSDMGTSIRNAVQGIQAQNDPGNPALNNNQNADLATDGEAANTTADAGGAPDLNAPAATPGVQAGGVNQFQIGAAGSAGANSFSATNSVDIEVQNFEINSAEDVSIDAVTNKWVGAWAGTAAVNVIFENNSVQNSTGVAGSVAVNKATFKTSVLIGGANGEDGPSLVIKKANELNIRSVSDGTLVAEGLAAAVSAGSSQNAYAFDADVSVNLVNSTVSADVSGLKSAEDSDSFTLNEAAWSGDNQVSGGIGFSFGKPLERGLSATASLVVAIGRIENTIEAKLSNSDLNLTGQSSVRALADLTQVTTAVGASVAVSNNSFALSGSAAASLLTNKVTAGLENVEINLSGDNSGLQVSSRSSNGDESKEFEELAGTTYYADNLDELSNTKFLEKVGLYTSASEEQKGEGSATERDKKQLSDFFEAGRMTQVTVSISPSVSTGEIGGGAAIIVDELTNDFAANASKVTITSDSSKGSSFELFAEDNVLSVGAAAGAAAGKGKFNAAGSLIVSNVDQEATVSATDLTVTASQVHLLSDNKAKTVNVAGNFSLGWGEDSVVVVGAAIVVANTNNFANIDVTNLTATAADVSDSDSVDVEANNDSQAWVATADGGVTTQGEVSIGGAVSVNRTKNEAKITVKNAAINKFDQVKLAANDSTELWTLAGNVSVATNGAAGISGAVAYTSSRASETSVVVDGLKVNEGVSDHKSDLSITADSQDRASSLVISAGAAGKVGLAGASSTNEITRTTKTQVKALSGNFGKLEILANSKSDTDSLGIVGTGSKNVAVGASVAINRITSDTEAVLENSKGGGIGATTLSLIAQSNNDIDSIGIGGAGAQNVAVAGSTAVNIIQNTTKATVSSSSVRLDSAGVIQARSDDTIGTYGGGGAGAVDVAAGVTVVVAEKKGETSTTITDSDISFGSGTESFKAATTVDDGDINSSAADKDKLSAKASLGDKRKENSYSGLLVDASSTETFKTFYLTGAGAQAVAADAGGYVVYSAGSTAVNVKNTDIDAGTHDVDIHAGDFENFDSVLVLGTGAQYAAVGAVVNVVTTDHSTGINLEGSADKKSKLAGGKVSIDSEAKEGLSSVIVAVSGAEFGALSVVVDVTRQLSDVATTVKNYEIASTSYAQSANYLGRISSTGVQVAGSVASVPVSVIVNKGDNDVSSLFDGGDLDSSGDIAITADRQTQWKLTHVAVSGGAVTAGAVVLTNSIEGTTSSSVKNAKKLHGNAFTIRAENKEKISNDAVAVEVGAGSAGAIVIVNNLIGSTLSTLENSTLSAKSLTLESLQTHEVDITSVGAGLNAFAGLKANVLATTVGSSESPLSDNEDLNDTTLSDTKKKVDGYLGDYAGSLNFLDGSDTLTANDKAVLAEATKQKASATKETAGTNIKVLSSTIDTESGPSSVHAQDTAKITQKAVGAEAGAMSLGATVAVLDRKIGNEVILSSRRVF